MNFHLVVQRIVGADHLRPYDTLTEKPAVIGRFFAGIAAAVTLLWSAVVTVIIAGDMLLGIFAVSIQTVAALFLILLVAFAVLSLLAAASTFQVSTVVRRHLITGADRLTYPRTIGSGILISLGSHFVLGVVLTILSSGALVVGHVFGVAHLTWSGIGTAIVVLIIYLLVVIDYIIGITIRIPLVFPMVVCGWLTWLSRHNPPSESPTTA